MDYEDFLLREQRNPNAAILEFFFSKYDDEDIVVMVEGDDDIEFYYDFVSTYMAGQTILFFPCSGKTSLLRLKEFLATYELQPAPKKMLFLIDKDFDDFLGTVPLGVFHTKYYSIENYFCDAAFFEYLLRKYTKGQIRSSSIPSMVKAFRQAFDDAAKALLIPMAILCSLREQGSDADFDAVNCHDVLHVCSATSSLRRKPTRQMGLSRLGATSEIKVHLSRVRSFAKQFSQTQPNYWLRGKYGLQLTRLILRAIEKSHPGHAQHLQSLQRYFGRDGLSLGSNFLGGIAELEAYCSA